MSGSIEISTTNEQIEGPRPIFQLPDADLHPDFTRYYQDALHNPDHPNGWGNAVILVDMLSEMKTTETSDAITIAQYSSAHKNPDEVDRPRLYKESLARAIVDLARLTGIPIDVITAYDLDKINGRINWTASSGTPDREAIQAILGDVTLPNSLTALRDNSGEANSTRANGERRRPSTLWSHFHKGEDTNHIPNSTRDEHLIKLGIPTMLTPEQAFDTNQILLLPQNYIVKKDPFLTF